MKYSLIILLSHLFFFAEAQEPTISFYKDLQLNKPSEEKNAKYKKVEFIDSLGILNSKVYSLKNNCCIIEKYFKDKNPILIWKKFSGKNCELIEQTDFSILVYNKNLIEIENQSTNEGTLVEARFGNDEFELTRYLSKTMHYPKNAYDQNIEGLVVVQFIVKANGEVQMGAIMKGINPYLDLEAWRVVEQMPKWHPATRNGIPEDSVSLVTLGFKKGI